MKRQVPTAVLLLKEHRGLTLLSVLMPRQPQSELFAKCKARIARANAHATRMAELWDEIPLSDLTEVESFVEDDGNGFLWLRPKESAWPEELELKLGEYLYQLRAALDGAVYACAIEDSGIDPPPNPSSTEFPICSDQKEWSRQERKLASLNAGRKRFIKLMQPFHEGELEARYRIANYNRCLGFLNDLARLDRHRRLHTFCTFVARSEPQFRYPSEVKLHNLHVNAPGEISDQPLATFSLKGWKRGMPFSANPNADVDLSLRELEPPVHRNDIFPNRLRAMAMAVQAIVGALEVNAWQEPTE